MVRGSGCTIYRVASDVCPQWDAAELGYLGLGIPSCVRAKIRIRVNNGKWYLL